MVGNMKTKVTFEGDSLYDAMFQAWTEGAAYLEQRTALDNYITEQRRADPNDKAGPYEMCAPTKNVTPINPKPNRFE